MHNYDASVDLSALGLMELSDAEQIALNGGGWFLGIRTAIAAAFSAVSWPAVASWALGSLAWDLMTGPDDATSGFAEGYSDMQSLIYANQKG